MRHALTALAYAAVAGVPGCSAPRRGRLDAGARVSSSVFARAHLASIGAQAAVHFAADLTRGGCLAGRLEGEVFISIAE